MLNPKEIKQLASLLKKINNPGKGLPQPVFEALCGVMPLVACELVVLNSKKEILLTWRDDKWWKGWHFPGGILLFKETFAKRIKYMALHELEIAVKNYKFLFVKNFNHGKRGPVVSLVFLCEAPDAPKHGRFFKKMPKNIIKDHVDMWQEVQKFI